jgi:hypothetical protein
MKGIRQSHVKEEEKEKSNVCNRSGLSCSIGVPLNSEFFSLPDSLGPSSTFCGSRRVQRLAMVSRLVVLLS